MSQLLLWTILLEGLLLMCGSAKPPEATRPGESIQPKIELSLLAPQIPREGDDVQLQCSAKPKNGSKQTKPENVHWIKGNVGVPEFGNKPGAERFVREMSEGDKGVILFTLTIKEAEMTDADKYMCIVQVGETGYFTSNEVDVDIKPGDPEYKKKREEAKKEEEEKEQDLEEILSWKERITELSKEELKMLGDAMLEDQRRKDGEKVQNDNVSKEEQEKVQNDNVSKEEQEKLFRERMKNTESSFTEEESEILKRRNNLEGMSEIDLFVLSNALKKERAIKESEEAERNALARKQKELELKKKEKEEKERKWREDIERQKKEEAEKAKREAEKKAEIEKLKLEKQSFKLTPEEKKILKRQDELADFSGEEIKLLHAALAKERDIEAINILAEVETKQEESDLELTAEEEAILERKDDLRSMSQDELKVMAKAVTKQKKIQEERKKKYNVSEDPGKGSKPKESPRKTRTTLDEQAKEPITGEELLMLTRKDDVVNLSNDQLPILARGLKKQQHLEDNDPNVGDDMTTDEMFNMLGKTDQLLDMEQEDLDLFLVAMIKQRQIRYGRNKKVEQTTKPTKQDEDENEKPITNEELLMLTKQDEIMTLGNDELPILARALQKQKNLEAKDPKVADNMSEQLMRQLMNKKNKIMDMEQDELDLLQIAMFKEHLNKLKPPRAPRPEDEMSEGEMRQILKWQDDDMSGFTDEQFRLLGTALLKEKKLNDAKKRNNDPLEEEEVDVHDEL